MSRFSEDIVEQASLAWLESAGWTIAHGPDIEAAQVIEELIQLAQQMRSVRYIWRG